VAPIPLTVKQSEPHNGVKSMSTEKKHAEKLPEWIRLVKSLKERHATVEDAS